ncbi:hypothetical protein H5410_036876 [Solanum commersonii]|uniref:Beta-galactosidase n=1 Tax=Solanum commersonii TaxID=4109 RepID=A0A9J5Y8N8_SOLCO|nr:hypothetical protein H5410_036876 [Solanum commersonii]
MYDDRAIVINGKRRILISGSVHYPRSTPEMWPDLIQKAKDGGLDVIETYVFWNGHEPSPGKFNFEGRYDVVKFIKLVQQAGLYLNLRIGPYICAEWNFGGFPVWLKYVAMQGFVEKIVNMMKSENLFEPQGGPIIMAQIENEYGPVIEWEIGAPGKPYAKWTAEMAVSLDTGVPWIMCKQEDAPDPVIDTCNGFYCENFKPNKPYKPKMWTEVWTAWYTKFGGPVPRRPAEDTIAVARFIQNNGSFFNYYMYHRGTNFGRTTAGRFIVTSYDYDAPLDEYGLLNEPKYGHLRDLHKAIKLSEPALVSSYAKVTWLGKNQEAHVYSSKSGVCAAFLSNYDPTFSVKVTFQNMQYDLPPRSISILPDCRTAVYNTARVMKQDPSLNLQKNHFLVLQQISSQSSQMKMTPIGGGLSWESYTEETPSADDSDTLSTSGLWEQINVTRDSSDYLWYMTDVSIASDEGFLKNEKEPLLTAICYVCWSCLARAVYGGLENPKLTYSGNVKLRAGINKISMLSVPVGLPVSFLHPVSLFSRISNCNSTSYVILSPIQNVGLHFETWNAGVLGPIRLSGLNEGTRDLTKQRWAYKVGMKGEMLSLHTLSGSSSVKWVKDLLLAQKQRLTWYKATFDAPEGNDPLALDMESMGKGQIWINGEGVGRHWPGYIARGDCGECNYAGLYSETKCQTNCEQPSQRCMSRDHG